MGLNYKHQGIVDFNDKYQKQMNTALENLNSLKKQILNYVGIESKGEFALQSQNYMNNAVIPSLEGIETVLQLYLDMLTDLIKTTLDTIDKQENGAVVSDHLSVYLELNDKIYNKINEIYPDINTNISNANNYGLNISKLNYDDTQYSQLKSKVETIHTNMQNLSNNNSLQQEVIACISNVQQLIKFMDGVNAAGIQTYNNDQLLNQDWYQGLINTTIEQIIENTSPEEWNNKSFPPSFSASEEKAFTKAIVDKLASGEYEWVNNLLNQDGIGEARFTLYGEILDRQAEVVYSESLYQELTFLMSNMFRTISANPIYYTFDEDHIIEYNYNVSMGEDVIIEANEKFHTFKQLNLDSTPKCEFLYRRRRDGEPYQMSEHYPKTWQSFYYIPTSVTGYEFDASVSIMSQLQNYGYYKHTQFTGKKGKEEVALNSSAIVLGAVASTTPAGPAIDGNNMFQDLYNEIKSLGSYNAPNTHQSNINGDKINKISHENVNVNFSMGSNNDDDCIYINVQERKSINK